MRKKITVALLGFLAVAGGGAAWPASADLTKNHVEASLLSENISVQPGQPFWVAIRLKMEKDWHVYWENPGDSGMAVKVKWTLPSGFKAGPLRWPVPQRISTPPFVTYGYLQEAVLLAEISPPKVFKDQQAVNLQARVEWLECKEECRPGKADLELNLPLKIQMPVRDPNLLTLFSKARFEMPLEVSDWKVKAFGNSRDLDLYFSNSVGHSIPLGKIEFFPEESDLIENAAEQNSAELTSGGRLSLVRASNSTQNFGGVKGLAVASNGWRGPGSERGLQIDVPLRPRSEAPAAPVKGRSMSYSLALFFAFVGGVLLNLMPCVLPVLSLKILGLIRQGQLSLSERWIHAALYSAGVTGTFLGLGGLLLFLRAGGESIGWGFQLQNPWFVLILALFLFLMTLNFFGLFEIGVSLTRINPGAAVQESGWKSFLSGVLATVVATPCTAPFMGSAMGYAITLSPPRSLSIFFSLGMGMAIPYLLLAIRPRGLSLLPKPGPWMEILKKVLGFLLLATVVWLLWVLSVQKGKAVLFWVLPGIVLLGSAAYIYGRAGRIGFRLGNGILILILGVLGTGMAFWGLRHTAMPSGTHSADIRWEAYSEPRLAELRRQGVPVLIDFTASWCLTCQVNERLVLNSAAVQKVFARKGVFLLKADWTSRDIGITRALEQFNRSGVPTYVLILPGEANPVILPEVLTVGLLERALDNLKDRGE